jgi:hypothetical protein
MPYFRVDDQLAFHPKAIAAGNAALGLWVRAGSWCAAHVTQGALPTHMVRTLGAQRRDAEKLVSVGLWTRTEDGYEFKDWADYQWTKEQVEAKREADRIRQSRRRASVSHAVTPAVTNAVTNAVSHTTHTKPVPEVLTTGARKRATQAPTDFQITDAMRAWAREKAPGIDLDAETERFLDNHRAKGTTFKDWTAAWRTWMSRAVQYASNGNGKVHNLRPAKPNTFGPGVPMPWDR